MNGWSLCEYAISVLTILAAMWLAPGQIGLATFGCSVATFLLWSRAVKDHYAHLRRQWAEERYGWQGDDDGED